MSVFGYYSNAYTEMEFEISFETSLKTFQLSKLTLLYYRFLNQI